MAGISGLPERALVIARELWRWREAEAIQQNRPPRRILRDDLIIELARRGKADVKQISAIRGMERSLAKRHFAAVATRIQHALEVPRDEWPIRPPAQPVSHGTLVGQFIVTALSTICSARQLAPSLVGTVQDVRDLVDFRLANSDAESPAETLPELGAVPSLARGWRAQVVGRTIDDLLAGRTAVRIGNPSAAEPLILEPVPPSSQASQV
jgi:ribonuclease D